MNEMRDRQNTFDKGRKTRNQIGRADCYLALAESFSRINPKTLLAEHYVPDFRMNLVKGVRAEDFEKELRQGDGNELASKFMAVHSSAALAVNAFAPFKRDPGSLRLAGVSGFSSFQFERKCPNGLGRKKPNLDLVAEGAEAIVAVESKCTEMFDVHAVEFSSAYDEKIRDARRQSAWFREMQALVADPKRYRWLDAAQLVKHAFGLAYTFPDRRVVLLYLFWEPANAAAFPVFAEHRAEVSRFAEATAGGGPTFVSMSYPELWRAWDEQGEPEWLATHVGRLRARYEVTV